MRAVNSVVERTIQFSRGSSNCPSRVQKLRAPRLPDLRCYSTCGALLPNVHANALWAGLDPGGIWRNIADASRHCRQIYIQRRSRLASDMQCIVVGPVLRELFFAGSLRLPRTPPLRNAFCIFWVREQPCLQRLAAYGPTTITAVDRAATSDAGM